MKKIYLLTTTAALLFLISACAEETRTQAQKITGEDKPKTAAGSEFVSVEDAARNALKAGDKMPSFELPNARKDLVKSSDLLAKSNLIVVFYRGEWCPYCNLYLQRLQKSSREFRENGGELVAVSVEDADESLTVTEKNKLDFEVLSDKNLDLARKFRIVYQLPPETDEKYKGYGVDLVKDNGTDKPELPLSATYIVKQNGEIVYAFLDPDYTKRLESDVIIAELKKIGGK
jgi:peroxiredoxin